MHGSWIGRLFPCGEHLRGSESGNLERFTVSFTSISLFLGFVLFFVLLLVFGLLVLVLFCVLGFVSPHDVEIFFGSVLLGSSPGRSALQSAE